MDSLPVELDLPRHHCFLPLVIGDGANIVTSCCQTSFAPDSWVTFDLWHAAGLVFL